jgi:hypothetical protein
MSNYTATREGDRVEIKENGKTISISDTEDAATLARVIGNVVQVGQQASTVAGQWATLVNRVRIQVSKKVAEKYLESTGREADENGMIGGALIRTNHASFIADHAEASGDLVILHTPFEPGCSRVTVLAAAIDHVSFDGE